MRQLCILLGLLAFGVGAAFGQNLNLSIASCSNLSGTAGTAYNCQFTASGGTAPYTFSVNSDGPGQLPPGLTLNQNGLLTGTPSTVGTYTFGIEVNDSVGNFGAQSFTINISPCSPTFVNTSPLPTAEVGINYLQTFSVTGCSGNNYSYVTSTLQDPVPGLTLA